MRNSEITRTTKETDISLSLSIDGNGESTIESGCGFLDHMLTLFAAHGGFDLRLTCNGDTQVDYHHTAEDIAICLGRAYAQALGEMRGVARYADIVLPMDESLVMCAVDISGRSYLSFEVSFPTAKVGDFDTELVNEFFAAFVRSSGITLHLRLLSGVNSHHIAEACFKAFARVLSKACIIDAVNADKIPSTKGILG